MRKFLFILALLPGLCAAQTQPETTPLKHVKSGAIKAAYTGIYPVFKDFDMDVKCNIVKYNMTVVRKNDDPIMVTNDGDDFTRESETALRTVKPGDMIVFDEIQCKCPYDAASRQLSSLVVKID